MVAQRCQAEVTVATREEQVVTRAVAAAAVTEAEAAAAAVTEAEAVLVAYRQGRLVGSAVAAEREAEAKVTVAVGWAREAVARVRARAVAATPLVVATKAATVVVRARLVVAAATEAEVGDCFPCHHRPKQSGGKRCMSACHLFASWTRPQRNSLASGTSHMAVRSSGTNGRTAARNDEVWVAATRAPAGHGRRAGAWQLGAKLSLSPPRQLLLVP